MAASVRIAPYGTRAGVSSMTAAISSITPDPMRPHGSAPTVVKMYTDSSAPVNLKNKVCNRMPATTTCSVQLTTD